MEERFFENWLQHGQNHIDAIEKEVCASAHR